MIPLKIREMKGRGLPPTNHKTCLSHRTFPRRINMNPAIKDRDKSIMAGTIQTHRLPIKKPMTSRQRVQTAVVGSRPPAIQLRVEQLETVPTEREEGTSVTSAGRSARGANYNSPYSSFDKVKD